MINNPTEKGNVLAFLARNPDLFKEMGNIGMGHACTALSNIIGMKVNRSIPSVWSLTKEEAAGYLDLFEGGAIGVILTLHEDMKGKIVHIVNLPFTSKLSETFFKRSIASFDDIDEMSLSVVQEMTNITTASFVNSISSMTGLFIDISTPNFCVELKEEVLAEAPEKMLVVENRFLVDMGSISSELLFMPDEESLALIAERLCHRYNIDIPDNLQLTIDSC
ncbi:MAG: chemotaxis protein CheC [Oscillospiraceae bacterium]|nr:chemotaxis protein CheC [Oscillospiraceae bacterium]